MTPERYQEVKRVLEAALEKRPDERTTFLTGACGDDPELRREVDSLLGASDAVGDFLAQAALEGLPASRLGPYRVFEEIGRGGMGAVYRAVRDDDQYQQEVAIKVVKRGMDTDAVLERFRYERQILAFLNHPNIGRLLDGGATEDGRPYLVMEFIQGTPITQYCEEQRLNNRERVQLFLRVCTAVEYAHRNLIVHRDLKPGNILITAEREPKLLDFGIAKILVPASPDRTLAKTGPVRMLTPEYASPEQVRGHPVTTATDVYSLGVVLYELLTGRRAHRLESMSQAEIERVVCREEPPKAGLGDLDHVLCKAMEKESALRYQSIEQFSADLERWLEGRPVLAREITWWYRSSKFIRRNRGAVIAAGLVAITLLGGVAATVWQARIARQERDRAQRRFNDVRRLANSFLIEHDALAAIPGGTATRSQLVKDALSYLDGLAGEAHGDPELQRELATAYEKMGDVQGRADGPNLGNTGAALDSYRKAIAIRERLAVSDPSPANRRALAGGYAGLSGALKVAGDYSAGLEFDRKALEIRERLLSEDPGNWDTRRLVASSYTTLGLSLFQLGDWDAVLEFRKKALAAYQELVSDGPSTAEDQRGLALAHIRMGSIYVRRKQLEAGLRQYEDALRVAQRGIQLNPNHALLRSTAATAHSAMGSAHLDRDESTKALEQYRAANAIYVGLSAADPNDARMMSLLSESHYRIGRALLRQHSPATALPQFRTSLELREQIAQRSPMNAGARGEVAESHAGLGDAYAAAGRPVQALDQYRQAASILEDMAQKGQLNAVTRQEFERVRNEIVRLR